MLLRRVTEHVRAQNWTAIALDFVIVVVGVFVGIQVSNWNEARVEQGRAAAYLDRIQADLASDIETLQTRKEFWGTVVDNGQAAIAFAEEGILHDGSEWATLRAFLHASQAWRWTFNNTTYIELRSAGDLRLIGDASLRDDLAFYYVVVAMRRNTGLYGLLPEYRRMVRGRMPSAISRYYWQECHHQSEGQQALSDCGPPAASGNIRAVLDDLASDQEIVDALRYWIDSQALMVSLADIDRQVASELVATISAVK